MPTYFKLDTLTLGGSITFHNLQDVRVTPNVQEILEYPAGHPHPMFSANSITRPAIRFRTREVQTVLANIGPGGLAVTSDSYLYCKLAQAAGIPDRTQTTHRRYRVPQLLAHWTQITIPSNGPSEATVILQAQYDGTNNPIIPQTTVQLPGTQTAPVLHGVGPVYVNASQVAAGSIQSVDASSGIQVITEGGDSEEFDRFVGVERTRPQLTVVSTEQVGIFTYGLQGTALDGSDGLLVYMRKFAEDGSRVANNVAEHMALQGLSGVLRTVESGGQGSGVMRDRFRGDLTALTDSVLPLLQLQGQTIA